MLTIFWGVAIKMNFEEEEIIEDDMILHDKIKPLRFSVVYDEVEVKL